MAIDSVSAAWQTDNEFMMKLLVAQLQNQDPMEPMSNEEMVSQMCQMSTLEAMTNLQVSFSEVLELQRLMGGTELIGRQVEYEDADGTATGEVESVNASAGTITLSVNGGEVALDAVTRVL